MNEAENIKEQKLAELKESMVRQQAEEEKKALAEQKIEMVLKRMLSPKAKARLKNVKLVNEERYWSAVQQLLLLYQSGRIQGAVSEEQIKRLLAAFSQKREIKIKRK